MEENRVLARENSTLVFATVAASASLLILTFVSENSVPSQMSWIHIIGFIFSILGTLYREVTIFTIDLFDYQKIGSRKEYPWFAIIPRMIIVRFFLFLPIAAWLIFLTSSTCFLATMIFTLVIAVLFSVIECLSRYPPTSVESDSTEHEREKVQSSQGEGKERIAHDPEKWFWETFSIMTSSLFIASLVASVPAQGLYKMLWGGSSIMFGALFLVIRLQMGRLVHAPRFHIFVLTLFLIAAIVLGSITVLIGYLQL